MCARAIAGLVLAGIALAGCGASDAATPIGPVAAQQALSTAFDRPLVTNVISGADATTSQIAGSFTGGNELEHLVAVVFRRPGGSRVLTGNGGAREIPGPDRTVVIRVANVVVMYSRAPGTTDRRAAFRRALHTACGGCADR